MISIIMPITQQVINEHIKLSLQSVLNQSFTDYHIIIGINSSIAMDTSYLKEYSEHIKIVSTDICLKYSMIAHLIAYATNEWIAFIEPGDVWYDNKLQTQWKFSEKYDIIGSACGYTGSKSGISCITPGKINEDSFLSGCPMVTNTLLIRKSLCKWNEHKYNIHADFNMLYKLFGKGYNEYNVSEILCYCKITKYNDVTTLSTDIQKKLIKKARRNYTVRPYSLFNYNL